MMTRNNLLSVVVYQYNFNHWLRACKYVFSACFRVAYRPGHRLNVQGTKKCILDYVLF